MAQQPSVIPGERHGFILLHAGYRYERNRTVQGSDKIYWRCADWQCGVPIRTNYFVAGAAGANIVINSVVPNHPHPPEFDRVDRHAFTERVKLRIEHDPSLPVRRA